ncbi:MAG TPA: HAD-IA family hydrolase [Solirubrobacteraceae bacterium]|nr:HAD-IA family hydrolase [Solirubrobacteraceae bacterium]
MNARGLIESAHGLLVDLDGTLVDSTAPVHRAWSHFAARHGLDAEHVHRFAQGRPSRESVRLLVPGANHAAEAEALERAELGDVDGIVALPGAAELLSGGWRLAVVTSCSRALAHMRLRAAGLPIPTALVSADDVERGKPDPTCYLLGAARLGVDPAGCVVLEDAPAGISAGRAAGARVLAVRTTHADHDLGDADLIVDDLSQIGRGHDGNGARCAAAPD